MMISSDSWGMDVFTPGELIKDQRILTCLTYNIFQVDSILDDITSS